MTENEARIDELQRIINEQTDILDYTSYLNEPGASSRIVRRGFIGRAKLRIKQLQEKDD